MAESALSGCHIRRADDVARKFGTRSSTAWLDSGVALLMETDDGNGL
jgi:hypothetical protein